MNSLGGNSPGGSSPGGNRLAISLDGVTDLPARKVATVVTYLEMTARPPLRPDPPGLRGLWLEPIANDVDRYLALYRRLGERWMWFSRLAMPRERVAAILADPGVAAFALKAEGRADDAGLLEIDARDPEAPELAFLGLCEGMVGNGAGRWLMNRALEMAWSRPIQRFWVHTCTFDHPGAVDFYRRSGFSPFKYALEIVDDPRLTGVLPRQAAPHVPLIGG